MAEITIAGRKHQVDVVNGESFVDGLTTKEFIASCRANGDFDTIYDLAQLFQCVLSGEVAPDEKSMQIAMNMIHANRTQNN